MGCKTLTPVLCEAGPYLGALLRPCLKIQSENMVCVKSLGSAPRTVRQASKRTRPEQSLISTFPSV